VTADLFPEVAPEEHGALRVSATMLQELADAVTL
jgi:hypothetical protein